VGIEKETNLIVYGYKLVEPLLSAPFKVNVVGKRDEFENAGFDVSFGTTLSTSALTGKSGRIPER
jgi:hypothetical protein